MSVNDEFGKMFIFKTFSYNYYSEKMNSRGNQVKRLKNIKVQQAKLSEECKIQNFTSLPSQVVRPLRGGGGKSRTTYLCGFPKANIIEIVNE